MVWFAVADYNQPKNLQFRLSQKFEKIFLILKNTIFLARMENKKKYINNNICNNIL